MEKLKQTRAKLLIASVAIVVAIAAAYTPGPKASMTNISPLTTDKVMYDGGSDYVAQCTRCHGGDGRGQTPKGRKTHAGDLTKSTIGNAKGVHMIAAGKGEMPAFKNSINADQIQEVMNYIRGFRR